MNSNTIPNIPPDNISINETYFFKAEMGLWATFSISLLLYWSGIAVRFPFIEVVFQLSVISLAIYAALIPFVKSWYNLEDFGSAIFNLSGIILLTTGATASHIYQLPWGGQVFMGGFLCTCYYHLHSPFRERTYQYTNNIEDKLIWLFVLGCLISFPACFIHEDLFPYPSNFFLYSAMLGFCLLLYVLFSFCWEWYKGQVRNYFILSYIPRILIMLYFAKGYEQFSALSTLMGF